MLKLAFLPCQLRVLVDNLWISCKKRSQILPLPPWGRSRRKIKVAGLLGQRFLETENSKWWTLWWTKIHTRLTWVSRVKKVIQQFYWLITFFGFNWGQSYLATLVTPQNCTKMLRNLTFVLQFAYFSITPKKVFVSSSNFWATFVTKSNFWLFFEQLFEK